jgi:hypothetical protein
LPNSQNSNNSVLSKINSTDLFKECILPKINTPISYKSNISNVPYNIPLPDSLTKTNSPILDIVNTTTFEKVSANSNFGSDILSAIDDILNNM